MNVSTGNSQKKLIRLLRIIGCMFFGVGCLIVGNIGGIAELFNLQADQMYLIVGGCMMFVGFLDIFMAPRILQMALDKQQK